MHKIYFSFLMCQDLFNPISFPINCLLLDLYSCIVLLFKHQGQEIDGKCLFANSGFIK